MIARFITLILIAVLALPVATLTRPSEPSSSPWNDVAMAAKGKKHKKKAKPPQPTTVTRTERQLVTQTFTSTVPIAIAKGASDNENKADPYPSAIVVSGFSNGTITDVNLILSDLTHPDPDHVDVLLSTNNGRRALVMSEVGANGVNSPVVDIDLTLDDEAAAALPYIGTLTTGTFRPTNTLTVSDYFEPPAPADNGSVALSTFDGMQPNGTWRLWVTDAFPAIDVGDFGGGWALEITAEVDVQVDEPAPDPVPAKDKKHKKKGKQRR